MRCWVKQHPVRITDETSYHARILAQEPTLQANFGGSGQISKFKGAGQARFVQNPEHWGPRPKHGRPMLPHERKVAVEAASLGTDAAAATESSVHAQAPAHSAPAAAAEVAATTPAPASDTDVAAGACAQQDTSVGVIGGVTAPKHAAAADPAAAHVAPGVLPDAAAVAAAAWDAPAPDEGESSGQPPGSASKKQKTAPT